MSRVRIADVARAAEVSTATVSHALRGTGRMTESTRRRVIALADALGYRAATAGRSRTIGLTVTTLGPERWNYAEVPYFAEVIGGATAAALAHGYALTVMPADPASAQWRSFAGDAVILMDSPTGDPVATMLRAGGVPVVFSGRPDVLAHDAMWVDNDHVAATRCMLDHLAAGGARRIALVADPDRESYSRTCTDAYLDWCTRHGYRPLVEGIDDGMYAAVERLVENDADALYGIYENVGLAALAVARDRGIRVPDELMVACMGENPSYESNDPPITTMSLSPRHDMRLAVDASVALLTGAPLPTGRVDVPFALHARRSTSRR